MEVSEKTRGLQSRREDGANEYSRSNTSPLPDRKELVQRRTNLRMGSKRFEGLHNLHLRNLFITNEIHGKRDEWMENGEVWLNTRFVTVDEQGRRYFLHSPSNLLKSNFSPLHTPLPLDSITHCSIFSLFASVLVYKWTTVISRQISVI